MDKTPSKKNQSASTLLTPVRLSGNDLIKRINNFFGTRIKKVETAAVKAKIIQYDGLSSSQKSEITTKAKNWILDAKRRLVQSDSQTNLATSGGNKFSSPVTQNEASFSPSFLTGQITPESSLIQKEVSTTEVFLQPVFDEHVAENSVKMVIPDSPVQRVQETRDDKYAIVSTILPPETKKRKKETHFYPQFKFDNINLTSYIADPRAWQQLYSAPSAATKLTTSFPVDLSKLSNNNFDLSAKRSDQPLQLRLTDELGNNLERIAGPDELQPDVLKSLDFLVNNYLSSTTNPQPGSTRRVPMIVPSNTTQSWNMFPNIFVSDQRTGGFVFPLSSRFGNVKLSIPNGSIIPIDSNAMVKFPSQNLLLETLDMKIAKEAVTVAAKFMMVLPLIKYYEANVVEHYYLATVASILLNNKFPLIPEESAIAIPLVEEANRTPTTILSIENQNVDELPLEESNPSSSKVEESGSEGDEEYEGDEGNERDEEYEGDERGEGDEGDEGDEEEDVEKLNASQSEDYAPHQLLISESSKAQDANLLGNDEELNKRASKNAHDIYIEFLKAVSLNAASLNVPPSNMDPTAGKPSEVRASVKPFSKVEFSAAQGSIEQFSKVESFGEESLEFESSEEESSEVRSFEEQFSNDEHLSDENTPKSPTPNAPATNNANNAAHKVHLKHTDEVLKEINEFKFIFQSHELKDFLQDFHAKANTLNNTELCHSDRANLQFLTNDMLLLAQAVDKNDLDPAQVQLIINRINNHCNALPKDSTWAPIITAALIFAAVAFLVTAMVLSIMLTAGATAPFAAVLVVLGIQITEVALGLTAASLSGGALIAGIGCLVGALKIADWEYHKPSELEKCTRSAVLKFSMFAKKPDELTGESKTADSTFTPVLGGSADSLD